MKNGKYVYDGRKIFRLADIGFRQGREIKIRCRIWKRRGGYCRLLQHQADMARMLE